MTTDIRPQDTFAWHSFALPALLLAQCLLLAACGGGSSAATTSTPPTPTVTTPTAPAAANSQTGSHTQITLSWASVTGATYYQVFRSTGSDSSAATQVSTGTQTVSPFSDTNLSPATTYNYWLKACNTAGCSDFGDPRQASTANAPTPAPALEVSIVPVAAAAAEGDTIALNFSISAGSGEPLTVDLSRATSSTATEDDYSLSVSQLSVAADGTISPQSITVTMTDDDIDEADESLVLDYALAGGATGISLPAATALTINDNDARGITVSTTAINVIEGDSASYTVVLDSAPTNPVTIALSSDNAAIQIMPLSLVFSAQNWNTAQQVSLSAPNDANTTHETASISYTVSGADYEGLTIPALAVAVADSTPGASLVVLLTTSPANGTFTEGTEATLTFATNLNPSAAVMINLVAASNSTAVADDDYTLSAMQVSIGTDGASTPANITVTATDDDIDENDETIVIAYTPSATSVTLPTDTTLTIADNDTRGLTATAAATVAVDEGATATYTLVLDSEPTSAVTVSLASDDAAIATVAPARLTFTSTNWDTAQTVTVSGTADDDTDHETATITYTVAGGDYASLTQAAQPVAVTDTTVVVDPSVSVTVNPANASISEGQMATLTFAISPLPAAAVTIDLAAAVASTAAADDYSFSATQVSIGTDGMSTPANITVTSTDDDTDEDDETLVIAYTVSAGATAPPNTTLTLSDDDARGISSTAAATVAVDEGAQTTYTLVLDSRPTETVTVSLASDDIAIATVLPAQLTFTSTNWNTAQTVTVSGTADVDTDRETASITYTVAGGDYATVTLAAQPVDVTDTIPGALPAVSVTVDPVDASISEGQTATLTFAIRPMPAAAVTIDLAAAVASTAAAADDYSFSATQVSIGTDGMSTPTSITVTSTDDDTDEDDETLVIAYTASTGATAPPNTTVTIIDDDARGISTTAAATVAVDEGADTTYTLVLDSRPTETVTINLASNNAATATVLPAQLTFTNANWNTAQTVTVSGTVDADTNDATTNINYTVTGGDYASFALAAQPVAVTDTTVEIPIITVSTVPVGGASEEGMTFMLNFAVSSSPSERIFVDLSVNPTSTATVTDDYTLVHPRVTINTDGSTTPQAVLVTTIDGDEIDEADETIIIDYAIGAGPAGVVAPASTTLTLTDDPSDVRGLTFKGADTLALSEEGEGSTITYSVKLNSEPSADVTLVVTSSDPGAVSVSSNNIVFNSVNWNSDARITLAAVGDGDPNHESVSISYTLSGGDYEGFVAPTHMAVVTDAEAPPPALPVLTITADVLSADEGGVITLSFAVSEAPTQDVTVNLSVPSASPTVGSSDYELSANSVTINTNGVVMPATVTVSVLDDNRLEFDEMITVSYLAATSGVVSIPTATHTLTLTDTDTSDLIVAPLTIDEDDITARVQFSTENSLAFDQNTQFDVALTALTAQPGTDYTAIAMDFSATIASGTAIGFVNVGIINDSVIEDSEQFTVTLTPRAAPPGLSASAQSGMVTINDDDGTVFVPQVVTVTEGTNTAATFNLTLAQVLPFAVDVQLTISGVTARAGTDYTNFNPTPMVVTIPAGMLSVPVEIPIIDDNLVEPNESFTVSVPMNGVISNGAPVAAVESLALVASVTIISDDRFVGFRGTRADLVEGGIIDLTVEFNPAPATDISLTVSSTNVGIMATEGTDYTVLDVTGSNPTYTLAVPGGATTASFRLMAATDAVVDDGERVALTLTAPVGYRLTDNATFTITLLNVRANTAGFAQAASSGVEGDVASMINVTVNPAPASDLPVTITRGGTASGTDFSPAGLAGSDPNYTLTIPAGQTSASFSVSALYDTEVDERETVTFTVTAPTDHNLGEYSVHTFTITDTPVRTVDFAVDRVTIVEGDDAQTVTINIDQPIPNQSLNLLITVDDFNFGQVGYELSENLRAPTGRGIRHSLELSAGDSSASFVVTISDDDMIQSLRSLSFTLSTLTQGSLYTIGSPGVYRLEVTDDDGGDVPLSPISLANDGQSGSMTQGGPIMPTRETSFELTDDGFQVMGGGSAIFSRTGGLYIRAPIAVSVDLVEEDNPSTTPFRNITRVGEYVKILDEMDIPNTDTNIAYLLRVYTPDNLIQGTHGITLRFMD